MRRPIGSLGAVVMMPGALIGGLFPKRPKSDSTAVSVDAGSPTAGR